MTYRETFSSLGEFLVTVANAATSDGRPDPRLEFSAVAGLNESVPSEGGFLVPGDYAQELWASVYETGAILSRCGRQPVSHARGIKVPAIEERSRADGSRFGGVRVYWANEADTVTVSRPKLRQIEFKPNKLLGLAYTTNELLNDAPALQAVTERAFRQEATFIVEDEIVNGLGSGRPQGILQSNALLTVGVESGQAPATFQTANFRKMNNRLWVGSRRNAVWLVNGDVEDWVAQQALATPHFVSYDGRGVPRILGKPVLPVEVCPAVGAVGDVILADLSQYLIAEQAPEFISSLHVRFLSDEGVFRFRWRLDGQSAWAEPITPMNSATTQSPFVTLAAR